MIKTRIFKFVGHIHNMQLCIEMISFINHENESILRWFYSFCEPRNFSRCPRSLVGVYSGGLGVWFMTFCCCLVEFGSSCFNHAWIESWFVWFGPWYTTNVFTLSCFWVIVYNAFEQVDCYFPFLYYRYSQIFKKICISSENVIQIYNGYSTVTYITVTFKASDG